MSVSGIMEELDRVDDGEYEHVSNVQKIIGMIHLLSDSKTSKDA
jgi:hypothetical protein